MMLNIYDMKKMMVKNLKKINIYYKKYIFLCVNNIIL